VISLRREEPVELDDFRHDRFGEASGFSQRLFGAFRDATLVLVMIKNRTPVMAAPVRELTSRIRRVDVPPELVE